MTQCPPLKKVFNNIRGIIHQEGHQMQDLWLSKKADEIQFYADHNDVKNFYSAFKIVYGPTTCKSSPFLMLIVIDW